MRLFRLLVTPEALNSGHVAQLKSMRQLSGLKKTQEEDLSAALGYKICLRRQILFHQIQFYVLVIIIFAWLYTDSASTCALISSTIMN